MAFIAWRILIVWGGTGVVMFLWGISLTFMDGRAADGVRTIGNSLIVLVGALVVFALLTPDGDDPASWRTGGGAGSYAGAGSGAGVPWGGGTTCDEDEWGEVADDPPPLTAREIEYLDAFADAFADAVHGAVPAAERFRERVRRGGDHATTYATLLEARVTLGFWARDFTQNALRPTKRLREADRLLRAALRRWARAANAYDKGLPLWRGDAAFAGAERRLRPALLADFRVALRDYRTARRALPPEAAAQVRDFVAAANGGL